MKIGVMGGTFDPIHCGHLAVAEEARRQAKLDRLVFMPAGQPYFKDLDTISPAVHRCRMLEIALGGIPYFSISKLEIDRDGPSYAVESMERMRGELGPRVQLYFVMGWDSLMSLYRWHEAKRLLKICRVISAPRPGYPAPDLKQLEKNLPGISRRALVMDRPLIDISATEIRRRVSEGLPIDGMVPVGVASYIREHSLYKTR